MKKTKKEKENQQNQLIKTADAPSAAVAIVGAPELVVQRASDRGVSCVLRNVRLTWVHVKNYREDRSDWRKGTKSVTALIPKKTANSLIKQLTDAVKQCLALSRQIVDHNKRMDVLKTACAVDVPGSLLKDGDKSVDASGAPRPELAGHLTWQIKTTSLRDSRDAEFPERVPLRIVDSLDRPVEPALMDAIIYSGIYADVALTLATYEINGNVGVTSYLNGIRKLRDGERLGIYNPFAGLPVQHDLAEEEIPF